MPRPSDMKTRERCYAIVRECSARRRFSQADIAEAVDDSIHNVSRHFAVMMDEGRAGRRR